MYIPSFTSLWVSFPFSTSVGLLIRLLSILLLMGKKGGGGSSWLTAVKRAFRSPSKETDNKTSSSKRREEHDHEDDEEKKREKRRWLFRKPAANQETVVVTHQTPPPKSAASDALPPTDYMVEDEQRHAITVAVASAAAAEAAVASAHAAVEVARLTRPQPPLTSNYHPRDHYAAILIQTAFRGYLGRRALRALKGLVKLQALVRGHNVRKQAKMTLRCMQALVRVQARVLDQRMRLSHDGSSRKSTFSDTTSILEARYQQDISDRRAMSRDGSSIADDWDERPHTIEEVKAMLQQRKESALKREKTLSQAFSHQIWRNGRSSSIGNEEELQDKPQWLDRWMATKPWDTSSGSRARASTDQRDPIKTVEIDTSQPYSYLPPNFRRSTTNIQNQHHQRPNSHTSIASPLHRSHHQAPPPPPHHQHSPITPSPSKTRPVQVRSASPRCIREDRSYNSSSQTPSLRSNYYYTGNLNQQGRAGTSGASSNATLPNYMAATESAKARVRSQSAPRQRPSTPERDRAGSIVKKRLSYPAPDPYGAGMTYGGGGSYGPGLRSPSFKSITGSHFGGLEQQSNYSSCCTDSLAGAEISPSATSDYRRWLR